ncbi:hypothetical protein [Pseudoalteromonas sp. S3776]|uniref:hypothetical protein n=1 Tax=Pseudoalteromonas sp. S3776 TaxID=579544 RepID=UPI00201DFB5C|nr:hypothetical protein [Pseudoalteromonas sp. S3776]
MNSAEFVDYIISVKMKQGKSRSEAVEWIDGILNSASSMWERIKDPLKTGAGLYPLFDDMKALAIIAAAMQRQGNAFGKFKIKIYNGSPAIIISSYPGIRAHLTGTRYLASNPKLFTIGMGKLEAAKSMKTGFVISLIISVTFHAIDQALNDQKTWHDLVAGIAVDMAVVGAAIATSSAIIAMGGTLIAGIAIAPLIIVVSVGFLFAWFFSDTTAYVDYVVKSLRIAEKNIIDKKIIINNQIQQLEESYKESPVDFMKNFFSIPTFNRVPRK